MIVRPATIDDLDELLRLGEEMRQESIIEFPRINPQMVGYFLENKGKIPGLILEVFVADLYMSNNTPSDGLVGFMVGLVGPPFFSEITVGYHNIFYVTPEHRAKMFGVRLIKAFEAWAIENGASATELCVDTGLKTDRTGRLYERMGYEYMGGKYRKSWEQQQQ